ncbi:ClpP/crotonase, partial [Amylostereum chailletii]
MIAVLTGKVIYRSPVNAFDEEYVISLCARRVIPDASVRARFCREYKNAFECISHDPNVRVVLLSSSLPRLFSSGIDLAYLPTISPAADDPARRALLTRERIAELQHALATPSRCPCPVLAAVHGSALGLAVDMLVYCDVVWAASDVKFGMREVVVGLAAGLGTLAYLPKVAGNAFLARELVLTGRVFGAEVALRLGLVSTVVEGSQAEVVEGLTKVACEIAANSPVAVVGTKHLFTYARDHSVEESLAYTTIWNAAMLQAPDLKDGVSAAVERTRGKYAPLGGRVKA